MRSAEPRSPAGRWGAAAPPAAAPEPPGPHTKPRRHRRRDATAPPPLPPRRPIGARTSPRAPPPGPALPGPAPRQWALRRPPPAPSGLPLRAPADAPPPHLHAAPRPQPGTRGRSRSPRGPRPRSRFPLAVPSGRYCATMVTVCPARFSAAAACSWVALRRFTPFTCRDRAAPLDRTDRGSHPPGLPCAPALGTAAPVPVLAVPTLSAPHHPAPVPPSTTAATDTPSNGISGTRPRPAWASGAPSAGRRARTRPAPAPPQDRYRAGRFSDSTHPGATSTPALALDPANRVPGGRGQVSCGRPPGAVGGRGGTVGGPADSPRGCGLPSAAHR